MKTPRLSAFLLLLTGLTGAILSAQVPGKPGAPVVVVTATAVPAGWSTTVPADEPYGAEPSYIAIATEGPPRVAAPLSVVQLKMPSYGYAARPGRWVWRKLDAEVLALLLGMNVQASSPAAQDPEVQRLRAIIIRARQTLTE